MSKKVTDLTPRQRRVIEALLEGKTPKDAAETVGISRKTLYVWLGKEAVRDELNRLGGIVLEQVTSRMVGLASEAVEALSKVLKAKDIPIGSQIQAANVILKRTTEAWELYSLNKRVEVLETLLEASNEEIK